MQVQRMYLVSRKYQIKYTLNNNNNKFVLRQTNIFMPQHKRIKAQMSLFTQYPKSNNFVFEKSTSIKYHIVASSNAIWSLHVLLKETCLNPWFYGTFNPFTQIRAANDNFHISCAFHSEDIQGVPSIGTHFRFQFLTFLMVLWKKSNSAILTQMV